MNDPDDTVTDTAETGSVVAQTVALQLHEGGRGANLARLAELKGKIAGAVQASRAASTLKALPP